MSGVFLTSTALRRHNTGLQQGIRGGEVEKDHPGQQDDHPGQKDDHLGQQDDVTGGLQVRELCDDLVGQVHNQA